MLTIIRYLLFPFSLIYGFIIWIRNKLFDRKILRSASFNFPLICIGNLAAGGTGKTPMTEYLVRLLEKKFVIATLSRGYKRTTKGFLIADENSTAADIGDEPMQMHKKFANLTVAVHEERVLGIPQLLFEKPQTQVIILDDAFQHREVNAGMNVLLTEYDHLYTRDFMLPTGNLRDVKNSSKRANIIVVTKCKASLNEKEKKEILTELNPLDSQQVFFTTIDYANPYHIFTNEIKILEQAHKALLISGIANPTPLEKMLSDYNITYEMMLFKDHYTFSINDIKEIKKRFSKLESPDKIILTTEKDATRLAKYANELKGFPIYAIPMQHKFLFGEEIKFDAEIISFVENYVPD